ncbi:MAG: NAD(P)/FAD-dependent oxidoreductase [Ilumatobacteraceae bacterium]
MTHTADAVVVGAGIAGLGAAAALAADRSVVVVEQESTTAYHASGRSAATLSETSGHPLVCAFARLSRDLFERPPEGFADHPLLGPRGLLWIGEPGDETSLDEMAVNGQRVAPSVRRIDASQTRSLLPTFSEHVTAAGAVHEPDARTIDAAAVLQGFIRLLRRGGGSVHTSSEAIVVEPIDHADQNDREAVRWRVMAGDLRIECRDVVDAAGAWGDVVAVRAGVRPLGLRPLRRTAAIARSPVEVAGWPLVMDIRGRYYCEPEQGGLLISPADEQMSEPCDARADEIDVALAIERVSSASGLDLRSIVRAWAGLRTFAPDRAPVVGEDPDAAGFWWLVGQGGAGIKTAPAMAAMLARLVRGEGATADEAALGVTVDAVSPRRLR